MIRKATINDIERIIDLLHQVDMVHHHIRPDLFKPYTTKYNEQELEALLGDDSKPVFVYDDGQVLGHAFCLITEVKDDNLLQHVANTSGRHCMNMSVITPCLLVATTSPSMYGRATTPH